MSPCRLVNFWASFLKTLVLPGLFLKYFYSEDGGNNLLRNINIYSAIYKAYHSHLLPPGDNPIVVNKYIISFKNMRIVNNAVSSSDVSVLGFCANKDIIISSWRFMKHQVFAVQFGYFALLSEIIHTNKHTNLGFVCSLVFRWFVVKNVLFPWYIILVFFPFTHDTYTGYWSRSLWGWEMSAAFIRTSFHRYKNIQNNKNSVGDTLILSSGETTNL